MTANCFGMKDDHRGWRIEQLCDDKFYGFGPGYDEHSGEGPAVCADTYDGLVDLIDEQASA